MVKETEIDFFIYLEQFEDALYLPGNLELNVFFSHSYCAYILMSNIGVSCFCQTV